MISFRSHFWPQGRERWLILTLLVVIAIAGYCVVYQCNQLLDAGFSNADFSSAVPPNFPLFDLEQSAVPVNEIFHGGPPKDGIPALTDPNWIEADQADYLQSDDRVAAVVIDGQARAYPLRILQWHEIVNDVIGDTALMMVYCPLCDSVSAFNREVNGEVLEFGVSGLLYQSNVLLYDRQRNWKEESLWSQMLGEAISGPLAGTRLAPIPSQLTTWSSWLEAHPNTEVLSLRTGYQREYNVIAYQDYFDQPGLVFPVNHHDSLFHPKQAVVGVVVDGMAKCYPVGCMTPDAEIEDRVGGKTIRIRVDDSGGAEIEVDPGVEVTHSFWFAWFAFYPDTEVYDGDAFDLEAWKRLSESQDHSSSDWAEYSGFSHSNCLLNPSSNATDGL